MKEWNTATFIRNGSAVYRLVGADDGLVYYVGVTCKPGIRYLSHLKEQRECNPKKWQWIQDLKAQGKKPVMEIIEVVNWRRNLNEREIYWIRHYRRIGMPITNVYPVDSCISRTA